MLVFYNFWDSSRARLSSEGAIIEINEQIDDGAVDNTGELAVVEVDGNEYLGQLYFPTIDLTLPVMADWDYTKLREAPCRYSGSYLTDDLVICGHNYASHFRPIKSLPIGTQVVFTPIGGDPIEYQIISSEVVDPYDVDEMVKKIEGTEWDLTLFTCTTGGRTRYAVRCERVTEEE